VARQVFSHDPPDRFVVGTVGEPGQRTFYLQARSGPLSTSVALEKQQVQILAERVEELLDEVVRRSGGSAPIPAVSPDGLEDLAPLEMPVTEEFRVGAMSLAWDGERERVVIEAGATTGEEDVDLDDDEEGPDLLRVVLTGAAARAFAKRAQAVVSAGRPPCPFCDLPLEPEGHICPRQNGYRRRA
jgi:uncharacterized repeat protein (TIGR03847 family)